MNTDSCTLPISQKIMKGMCLIGSKNVYSKSVHLRQSWTKPSATLSTNDVPRNKNSSI